MKEKNNPHCLDQILKYLKLPYMRDHHQELAKQASQKQWSHLDYFEKLASGEGALRKDRSIQRAGQVDLRRGAVVEGQTNAMTCNVLGFGDVQKHGITPRAQWESAAAGIRQVPSFERVRSDEDCTNRVRRLRPAAEIFPRRYRSLFRR